MRSLTHTKPCTGLRPLAASDAVSYDAVRLLLEAAERAGSLDADEIRQQLLATEQYAEATRIASYNENRHPAKSAVIMTLENGEKQFYQQMYP